MRLTLRSLLAYMHGLLSPQDARLLEDKIRQSQLAQHTMQRVSARSGSANIGLPEGRGVADANVVAEYLDNTLPDDDVPQFERVCFENDAQLIEVASAHRILSDIVRQNPRVADSLRAAVKQKVAGALTAGPASHAGAGRAGSNGSAAATLPAAAAQTLGAGAGSGERHLRADAAHPVAGAAESLADAENRQAGTAALQPVELAGGARAAGQLGGGLDLTDAQTNSVPEYLRDRGHSTATQLAAAAVLLIALCTLVVLSIGSFDKVRQLFDMKPVVVAGADGQIGAAPAVSSPVERNEADLAADASSDASEADTIAASAAAPPSPISDAAEPVSAEDDGAAVIASGNTAPPISDSIAIELEDPPAAGEIAASDAAPPAVGGTETVRSNGPPPTGTEGSGAPVIEVASASPPGVELAASAADTPQPETQSLLSWQPETKDSSAAVVMAFSPQGQTVDGGNPATSDLNDSEPASAVPRVRLVNVADVLPAEDRLVVPDAYRTEIRIQPGLKWVVASATDLQGLSGPEPKTAYARLRIGRGLIYGTADCDTLVLHVGGRRYKVVLDTAMSIASVELRYAVQPGVRLAAESPEAAPAYTLPVLTIAAAANTITVQSAESLSWSPAITLSEGQALRWLGGEPPQPLQYDEAPWWYRTSIERPIDSAAAKDLALELQVAPPEATEPPEAANPVRNASGENGTTAKQSVAADPPTQDLIDVLRATTQARRSETAALAARTLALLGVYDAIISRDGILNQSTSRPHRDLIVSSLIQSIGVEPQRRKELAAVLQDYDPPRGQRLLNLLALPAPGALQEPQVIQPWIDALKSPYLDERVLAIYQLVKITGKELGYQPDRPSREAISQWVKYQQAGKIQWSSGSAL